MTSLLFAALLRASIMATAADATAAADDYADAHRTTMETGKPLVVMVSTEWCAPCQQMKRTVIPQVRQRGLLRKVAFAIVNPDRDHDLAEKLTGGGPVPQLVMYRRTLAGWRRKILVGGQSVESVEKFISDGVAADEADKDASPEKQPEHATTSAAAETASPDNLTKAKSAGTAHG